MVLRMEGDDSVSEECEICGHEAKEDGTCDCMKSLWGVTA